MWYCKYRYLEKLGKVRRRFYAIRISFSEKTEVPSIYLASTKKYLRGENPTCYWKNCFLSYLNKAHSSFHNSGCAGLRQFWQTFFKGSWKLHEFGELFNCVSALAGMLCLFKKEVLPSRGEEPNFSHVLNSLRCITCSVYACSFSLRRRFGAFQQKLMVFTIWLD